MAHRGYSASRHLTQFAQRRWADGTVDEDMKTECELMILACGRGIGDDQLLSGSTRRVLDSCASSSKGTFNCNICDVAKLAL